MTAAKAAGTEKKPDEISEYLKYTLAGAASRPRSFLWLPALFFSKLSWIWRFGHEGSGYQGYCKAKRR